MDLAVVPAGIAVWGYTIIDPTNERLQNNQN
jgi:hypothetical protein